MAQPTPTPAGSKPTPQEELAALIAVASKRPGVQELMQVYQQWQSFGPTMLAHQRYLGIHRVSAVSNSSSEQIFKPK